MVFYDSISVIQDFATDYFRIYYMNLTTENSIVVCGEQYGITAPDSATIRSLARYRLENGQLMCNTDLRAEMMPAGMATVTLNGQSCVAVSYYQSVHLYNFTTINIISLIKIIIT